MNNVPSGPRDQCNDSEFNASKVFPNLRWLHWVVVATSVLLTIVVWVYTSHQEQRTLLERFDRASKHSVELVRDRMEKYEGSLWGGVGMIQSLGTNGTLRREDWIRYYEGVGIVDRYPGINGIGVIHHVPSEDVARYESTHADEYPELPSFGIHPVVETKDHFPITFIEPFGKNKKAVGLDMAFEANRLDGALRTMRTGLAQITGPIVLVQDAEKTPGFLLYTPVYANDGTNHSLETFLGMVYAPFVVKDLMIGALDREHRSVSIRIIDDGVVLYDELVADGLEPRPKESFQSEIAIDLYGRTWRFDIRGTQSFDSSALAATPNLILAGGIVIDVLLFAVFVVLTRSNQRAEERARHMTVELRGAVRRIESVNEELVSRNHDLEQFTYIASHDLQAPLRTIANYAELIEEDFDDGHDESERGYIRIIAASAERMRELLLSVLEYARAATKDDLEYVHCGEIVDEALQDLGDSIQSTGAQITVGDLPTIHGSRTGLAMVFRNLISNGIKFRNEGTVPTVEIFAERQGNHWHFRVRDNGIGIPPRYRNKIFEIFQRLHTPDEYSGTGIGLTSCMRVIESHGGDINVASIPGGGSEFSFTLPC